MDVGRYMFSEDILQIIDGMNISNNIKEYKRIKDITIKHEVMYCSVNKKVVIYGPIAVEDFIKLRNYLNFSDLKIKDIIVK